VNAHGDDRGRRVFPRRRGGAAALLVIALLAAAPAAAYDSDEDARNRAKSGEREREHQTPEYQAELRTRDEENFASGAQILASDPDRAAGGTGETVCFTLTSGCAGDIRLYDFQPRGRGLVTPVLWTARNGSTVSGHVWATRSGPAKRPGIVITNGSLQASEQLYWWAAQTLAKAGYVVVTYDPQQQARSDTFGEGADRNEGVPSQTAGNTFFDWTEDALDFLLSSPGKPFCARPSRSGTSHCDKQRRRVDEGRNAAFNPFWDMVDPERIGIAGHSYGAAGVSWVGQQDKRVDAVVAWDNLCDPTSTASAGEGPGGGPCLEGGQGDPPGYRVPSLGITNDYFTGTESRSDDPDPLTKSRGSRAFSKAGVDTGSVAIRGGTHFEFSYLPVREFRATLRGMDLAAFYTTAWFDKYVKGDPTADARLLSERWRRDPGDLAVDPAGGGNLYSFYYRSRLDFRRADGTRFTCENLRAGCPGQVKDDGLPKHYSFLANATAPDGASPSAGVTGRPRLALRVSYRGRGCSLNRTMRLRLKGADAGAVYSVVVRHRGRVAARGGRGATIRLRKLRRSGDYTLTATLRDGRKRTFRRHLTLCTKRR
jgi:dienelactone hydrolase